MPRLFTRLASGLAPSVRLGGERGGGMWFPDVFATRLKSLNGKAWQECRDFFVARLHDGASCLPHRSAATSGEMLHSCLCPHLPMSFPRNHPSL